MLYPYAPLTNPKTSRLTRQGFACGYVEQVACRVGYSLVYREGGVDAYFVKLVDRETGPGVAVQQRDAKTLKEARSIAFKWRREQSRRS